MRGNESASAVRVDGPFFWALHLLITNRLKKSIEALFESISTKTDRKHQARQLQTWLRKTFKILSRVRLFVFLSRLLAIDAEAR
jgi:hypothetical protein